RQGAPLDPQEPRVARRQAPPRPGRAPASRRRDLRPVSAQDRPDVSRRRAFRFRLLPRVPGRSPAPRPLGVVGDFRVTPAFSVVIPTFERPETLHQVLEALGRQAGSVDFEVIVVDDGSRDATPERLRALAPPYPFRS